MLRDIEDWVFFSVIIGALVALFFIVFVQSDKMDDCRKRGGYVVDTTSGWVCAKLERV
jgi:hypothetical protein